MATRLLPQRTDPAGPKDAAIEHDEDGFVVPAELLAEGFGLPVDQIRDAMRAGRITSRSETGTGADAGRWRLTFHYGGHACRFIVDENASLLSRAAFPVRGRSPQ